MAFVARKRGIELLGLDVSVVGSYDGLKFDRISVRISSGTSRDVLERLLPEAERVCYVSNTLRHQPELVVDVS
jgi:organic hydroperoxide reductase OsmC/OhrA